MPTYSYDPTNVTLSTLCASVQGTFPGNFITASILTITPNPRTLFIEFTLALTVPEQASLDALVVANKAAYVPPVPQTPPPWGMSLAFGADMIAAGVGEYYVVNGRSDSTKWAALTERTQAASPVKGFITRFAWSTESAGATTVIKILVNGAVVATFNLTGLSGAVVLATPVAVDAGARIAVEYDAGAAPNEGNCSVYIEPTNP